MGDQLLSRLRSYLGSWGLALVVLAPILAGGATAAATPLFIRSHYQATSRVQLYPAIGTHAAYDVSSYVADFVSACTGSTAKEKAAQASGNTASDGLLTAIREGDNAGALVTYTAPTPQAAEAGLRAAAQEALREVVQNDVDRQKLVVGVAADSLAGTLADFDALAKDAATGMSAADVAAARASAVAQAGQRMQQARSELITTEAALRGIPRLISGTTVTTSTLSSTASQIRVIGAAAASAFVVTLLIVLLVRRRTVPAPRSSDPGEDS